MCSNDGVVQRCSNACPVIKDTIPDFIMIKNSAHVSVNSFLFSASSRRLGYLRTFPVSNNCREKMLTIWIKTLNHQLLSETFWLHWVFTDDLKYIQEKIEYHEDLCDPHINPWLGLSHIHITSLLLRSLLISLLLRSWLKTLSFSFKYFRAC